MPLPGPPLHPCESIRVQPGSRKPLEGFATEGMMPGIGDPSDEETENPRGTVGRYQRLPEQEDASILNGRDREGGCYQRSPGARGPQKTLEPQQGALHKELQPQR